PGARNASGRHGRWGIAALEQRREGPIEAAGGQRGLSSGHTRQTGVFMSAVAEHVSTPASEMPAPLIFTDSAADKLKQLVDEEGNPDLKLRVFVQGGGCSG